jgi:hypothetical protein
VRHRVGIEARRALGDFAQHQRRHPRPRLRHAHERFDESIELRGGVSGEDAMA